MKHLVETTSAPALRSTQIQALAGLGGWVFEVASEQLLLSDEAAGIYGLPRNDSPVGCRDEILARIADDDRPRVLASWHALLSTGHHQVRYCLRLADGTCRWVWEKAELERDEHDQPVRAHGFVQDITEAYRAHAEIAGLANHDPLTGLPNRRLASEFLNLALPLSRRNRNMLAVLFVDLDRFKQVNDQFGHETGDHVLRQVAVRMRACFRASDMVARQGGDEFIVVLQDLRHDSDAGVIALSLVEELSRPFDINGIPVQIGASVGIALFPHDGHDAETLFRHADMAMYRAKSSGPLVFFDASMQHDFSARCRLASDLRRALENGELALHYEPVYRPAEQRLSSAEALLRWNHPEHGPLDTEVFMPTAEKTGLMEPLTRWIVTQACQQIRLWHQQGLLIPVSVNLMGTRLADDLPPTWLRQTLETAQVPPWMLGIEIGERLLTQTALKSWLAELETLNVRVILDDFGSGPTALAHLNDFNLRHIKIDADLVRAAEQESRARQLVRSLVDVGKNMDIQITAKGIDSRDILMATQALGCRDFQGSYLGSPSTPEHVLASQTPAHRVPKAAYLGALRQRTIASHP